MLADARGNGKRRFEEQCNDTSEGANLAVTSLQTEQTLLYNYPSGHTQCMFLKRLKVGNLEKCTGHE
jgi:hypothetical protein